jgi:hypothetical protein
VPERWQDFWRPTSKLPRVGPDVRIASPTYSDPAVSERPPSPEDRNHGVFIPPSGRGPNLSLHRCRKKEWEAINVMQAAVAGNAVYV